MRAEKEPPCMMALMEKDISIAKREIAINKVFERISGKESSLKRAPVAFFDETVPFEEMLATRYKFRYTWCFVIE
jgi:hypothetical protein